MIFGLKINFRKSCLYGVGVEEPFLMVASQFLACKTGLLPLKFHALNIGGKLRRVSFWKPIIECIKARLSSWKDMLLSIRGRVTLINSVITNIPIHHLSFYKVSVKVIKVIKFIYSWSLVCKPKEVGGLGIKDMAIFNRALLSKWLWRFIHEPNAIWVGIIEENTVT